MGKNLARILDGKVIQQLYATREEKDKKAAEDQAAKEARKEALQVAREANKAAQEASKQAKKAAREAASAAKKDTQAAAKKARQAIQIAKKAAQEAKKAARQASKRPTSQLSPQKSGSPHDTSGCNQLDRSMYSTASSPLHLDNEDNTFHDLYDLSFLQHIEDTFINQTRESINTSEDKDADFEVDEPDLSLHQLVTPIRPRGGKAQPVPKSVRFGIVLDNSSPSGQVKQVVSVGLVELIGVVAV